MNFTVRSTCASRMVSIFSSVPAASEVWMSPHFTIRDMGPPGRSEGEGYRKGSRGDRESRGRGGQRSQECGERLLVAPSTPCHLDPASPRRVEMPALEELAAARLRDVFAFFDHHVAAREDGLRHALHLQSFVAGVVDVHVVRLRADGHLLV